MDSQSHHYKLLRVPAVLERLGIGRATLYKMLARPGFPQQVRIGGYVAWVEREIDEFIERSILASRSGSTSAGARI